MTAVLDRTHPDTDAELLALAARLKRDVDIDTAIADIAVAMERVGAAEGAYTLAWRARQRLYGFFAAVVCLAVVLTAVWLIGDQTARQVDNTGNVVEDVAAAQASQAAHIEDLERRLAGASAVPIAPPPVDVVPVADVTTPPESAPPSQAETREPVPTEASTDGTPAAAHSEPSTPPTSILPAAPAPNLVTHAHLVDGCVLGVCATIG